MDQDPKNSTSPNPSSNSEGGDVGGGGVGPESSETTGSGGFADESNIADGSTNPAGGDQGNEPGGETPSDAGPEKSEKSGGFKDKAKSKAGDMAERAKSKAGDMAAGASEKAQKVKKGIDDAKKVVDPKVSANKMAKDEMKDAEGIGGKADAAVRVGGAKAASAGAAAASGGLTKEIPGLDSAIQKGTMVVTRPENRKKVAFAVLAVLSIPIIIIGFIAAVIFYAAAKSCKYQDGDNEGKHIITRGKNNKGIQGGCIWISCKKTNTPISAKYIAEHFNLSLKELNKGIKSLKKLLEIKNMSVHISVMGSEHYVRKYCIEMNIKEDYMNQAIKIAKNIDKLNVITEHTQFSIAATSILIMAEINSITNMSKKTLKEMFGVSNVTISKTYKKLEKIKHILIDDEKVEKIYQKILKLNEAHELSEDIKKRMEKFGISHDKHINKCETTDQYNNIISDEKNIQKSEDNNILKQELFVINNKIINKNKKEETHIKIINKR